MSELEELMEKIHHVADSEILDDADKVGIILFLLDEFHKAVG